MEGANGSEKETLSLYVCMGMGRWGDDLVLGLDPRTRAARD